MWIKKVIPMIGNISAFFVSLCCVVMHAGVSCGCVVYHFVVSMLAGGRWMAVELRMRRGLGICSHMSNPKSPKFSRFRRPGFDFVR